MGLPSRRVQRIPTWSPLPGSAPGEAQYPISYFFRYGDVWTDWRTTSFDSAGNEETLELSSNEHVAKIAGYSWDVDGDTCTLQAKTSAGRSWGPYGSHSPAGGRGSLRSSPATSKGLRLNHTSGDQTKNNMILRWLLQYIQMKTCMIYIDSRNEL